jgi:hypothetical protein
MIICRDIDLTDSIIIIIKIIIIIIAQQLIEEDDCTVYESTFVRNLILISSIVT